MLLLRSSTSQPREQIHEKNSKSGLNLRENLHTVELKFVKDPLTLKKKKKNVENGKSMKPYFLENCIQLPRNLINIFNASLNLYKNNFRSTLTISFAATFIQFFSHDFVLRFLSNLLLKLETIHVVLGIMSIIKKKKEEKREGGIERKGGRKTITRKLGFFPPSLPCVTAMAFVRKTFSVRRWFALEMNRVCACIGNE